MLSLLAPTILSLYFWKERVFFADMAFHTFSIMNDEFFAIQSQRFGAAITQLPLVIATKLSLPLWFCLPLYSVSYYLMYIAIALILWFKCKSEYLFWSVPLILTAMSSSMFYWCTFEMQQGMVFLLLLWGFIEYKNKNELNVYLKHLIEFLLLIVSIFYHPLMIIFVVFTYAFLVASNKVTKRNEVILAGISALLIYVAKFLTQIQNPYDSGRMKGLKNFATLFPNYFQTVAFKTFIQSCFHDYYIVVSIFIVVVIYYAVKREGWKLFLVASFSFGYLMLLTVADANVPSSFFTQTLHQGFAFFTVIPFMRDVVSKINFRYVYFLLFIIVLVRVNVTFHSHKFFEKKFMGTKKLVEQTIEKGCSKSAIEFDKTTSWNVGFIWSLPYESILYSAYQGGDCITTTTIRNIQESLPSGNVNSTIIFPYGRYDTKQLNQKYFKIQEGGYCILD